MGLLGDGEGHTCLILTDAESRLIRGQLAPEPGQTNSETHQREALAAFSRGIVRGTARVQEEFNERQKAKRKP
jgi:hypothetical protein